MNRKKIPLLVFVVLWINASAELHPFGPSRELNPILYIELVGGANMPTFSNTVSVSGPSSYDIGYAEGIAVRYQILNKYSVAGQLTVLEHRVNYGVDNEYHLQSRHFRFSVPLEIEFGLAPYREMVSEMVSVFFSPYIINNGNTRFKAGKSILEVPKSQLPAWDYGVESGIGFRIPVFSEHMRNNLSLKASYYHGLNNSFALPTDVSGESELLKSALLSKSTYARNRGFSFTLIYEFSMKKYKMTTFTAGGNGKLTYDRFVIQ